VGTRLTTGASDVIMFTGLRRARPDRLAGDAVRRELPAFRELPVRELPGFHELTGQLPDRAAPMVGMLAAGAAR